MPAYTRTIIWLYVHAWSDTRVVQGSALPAFVEHGDHLHLYTQHLPVYLPPPLLAPLSTKQTPHLGYVQYCLQVVGYIEKYNVLSDLCAQASLVWEDCLKTIIKRRRGTRFWHDSLSIYISPSLMSLSLSLC